MNDKQKNRLIPKLRFSDFKDSGKWEVEPLGSIYTFKTTNSFSRSKLNNENGTIKNIHYGDIHTKFSTLFDISKENVPYINSDVFVDRISQDNYCTEGDIIFADASEDLDDVGKSIEIINLNNEKLLSGLHTFLARQIEKKLIIGFGGYLFKSDAIRNQIKNEAQGAKVLGISKGRISNIKICYPKNKKEQQKIASCLSSLDELLEARKQKLELLKAHKKGLMQNLFPSGNDELSIMNDELKKENSQFTIHNSPLIPRLRFPEFKDSGEWEVEPFGNIYTFKTTNSFSRSKLNYEKGTVKNIHYGDIHTKFSTLFDITKENVPYINLDVPIDRIDKDNYCIEGDMVFADASEDLEDVGKSIEIINVNNEKLLSGLHTFLARQINNKLIIGFGGYLFKSDTIRNQIKNEAQGAKVLGISKGRISTIKIPYPKNKKEQQKIAECLSSVDELITAEAEKIEQLEKHKKGLMQGLFPAIDET